MRRPPPSPDRFVAAAAIIGAAVPVVATTIFYTLAPAVDRMPRLFWVPAFIVALSLRALWPPMVKVIDLMRQGVDPGNFVGFLVSEAIINAFTYAALGALLWYALYRRRWAWGAFAGILVLFWLRV